MPEVGNEYAYALLMLLCGSQMMHGTVKAFKWDLDGNPIGCQYDNPIAYMHLYDKKFPDGEVTTILANVIAQAMHARCEVDWNEILLLESLVSMQKDPTAVSLDD